MSMADQLQGQQTSGKSIPLSTPRSRAAHPSIRLLEGHQLPQYIEDWQELAGAAVTPNPFYESWTLLPAIDHLTDGAKLRFLLVFGPEPKKGPAPLWGFFPLEVTSRCLGLPIRTLAFWEHKHCFLTVPLIHACHTKEVLDAFWRWFERNPLGCRILDTNHFLAEGPLHEEWADFAIGRVSFTVIDYPRAFLAPSQTAESYVSSNISKKHRDEFLRWERRLAELGKLEYHRVDDIRDLDGWIDEFLRLEAAGWKGGPAGAAFAKEAEQAAYLRTISREGFRQNRVMLLSLTLNGRPIAMKHNLLSGEGGFTFKIAYDETFAKYSPGVLLELENIRAICDGGQAKWLDSCAHPRHVMANRIWRERRMIRQTLLSNSSRAGDFLISVMPLLRWVKKQVWPGQIPHYFRSSTQLKADLERSSRDSSFPK
jgi:CelD/BcsL family acetyltransferase involved in cellulose biosynthesis